MTTLNNMTNVTFDEIKPGASASLTRILTRADIELVALVSGDIDPFHVEKNGSGIIRPDTTTTDAVGAEPLIAAVLGTRLPGPGMKILRQNLQFHGRIAVGDVLTATVTVKEKRAEGAEVLFACRCVNQAGDEVVTGSMTVGAPTKRVTYAEVVPPELSLRRGDAFAALFKACEGQAHVTCAIVHPCDRESLLGPIEARRRGFLEPVFVGPVEKMQAVAKAEGIDLRPYRLIPASHSTEAA